MYFLLSKVMGFYDKKTVIDLLQKFSALKIKLISAHIFLINFLPVHGYNVAILFAMRCCTKCK